MTHLNETELIEWLDGGLKAERAAHAVACVTCQTELSAIRSTLEMVAANQAPEPSPLFWDHFGRRVNERIDRPAPDRARHGISGWFAEPRRAALVTAVVLIVAIAIGFRGGDDPASIQGPAGIAGVPPAPLSPVEDGPGKNDPMATDPLDDIDADAAWAVVRTAAEDMGYEEARAEGLAVRPDSAERVALGLSGEELAELARLIENELKRTGA